MSIVLQKAVNQFLSARSRLQIAVLALMLVLFVGIADYYTGTELSFSIFYLVPVALSTWYSGSHLGVAISLLSVVLLGCINYSEMLRSGNLYVFGWNEAVHLGFFLIVSQLLNDLRRFVRIQTHLAREDSLTRLLNRRSFENEYRMLSSLANRAGKPIVLGYIDVDGFKGINDQYGHPVGDEVLKSVANTLRGRLRESDLVARMGGDEFAVLLLESQFEGVKALFAELHFILLELAKRNHWSIGFSIGVVLFRTHSPSFEDAVKVADSLMYEVKRSSKNRVVFKEM